MNCLLFEPSLVRPSNKRLVALISTLLAPKYKERPIPHASCISCTLRLFSLAMIIMWGLRTFRPETFFIYTFICETSFFFIHLRYTRISLYLWAWFGKFGLRGFISWHHSQPSAHHLSLNKWSERLRDFILLDFVQNYFQILNFEARIKVVQIVQIRGRGGVVIWAKKRKHFFLGNLSLSEWIQCFVSYIYMKTL